MKRRISKANTNYQAQLALDHLFKKMSCSDDAWRLIADPAAALDALDSHSRNLALFFDNPQVLLSCRRLEHFNQAQRLREGVYILMRGRIRVLLCKQAKTTSRIEIEHAIHKMERRPRNKQCLASSKLNVVEATQPYQVVFCAHNCLALPDTAAWFVSAEELVEQHFYERLGRVGEAVAGNCDVFQVSTQLPFIFRQLLFSFRSGIEVPAGMELAIIKRGSVLVQWSGKPCQKLIVGEGSVLIRSKDYRYYCQSSEAELIGVTANQTFRYHADPAWTRRPEATPPTLPKEPCDDHLLFRSRSINLERLTAHSLTREKFKKTASPGKSENRMAASQSAMDSRDPSRQDWLFMRQLESFQVASNTRSDAEYRRIEAIRERFRKKERPGLPGETLSKKQLRSKFSFSRLECRKEGVGGSSQLFSSVSNFFNRQVTLCR